MRGCVLRAVALVAIAGQLQLLPAAITCAADHDTAAEGHCGTDATGTAVAVMAAATHAASPLCTMGVGCRTAAAGFLTVPASTQWMDDARSARPADARPPVSLDLSPVPPPPQA